MVGALAINGKRKSVPVGVGPLGIVPAVQSSVHEVARRRWGTVGGVERVWDYPRPPGVTPCERRVRVEVAGEVLAESIRALRVLETSHPPTVYIPPVDVQVGLLVVSDTGATWCEFKGAARYLDAVVDARRVKAVAWSYPNPTAGYEALRDHVAFYPGRVDGAWLDDERVRAQPGDFYGGWITRDLVGPFKGAPGTRGW